MLIHVPVGLSVAVALLAPAVLMAWRRGVFPRRTWWLVLMLQAVLLVGVVAAVHSGELAEQSARRVVDVQLVDRHEDLATGFAVLALITTVLSLAASLAPEPGRAHQLALATVVAAVLQLGACVVVSHAGGTVVWGPDGLVEQDAPP